MGKVLRNLKYPIKMRLSFGVAYNQTYKRA